jgi:uncharacterized protein
MDHEKQTSCTAFEGTRRIASGELAEVALRSKEIVDRGGHEPILIFDDVASEPIEIDFRGTADDVVKRLATRTIEGEPATAPSQPPRGPGRPRLGVVAREITLLPRHWDWLNDQPGGASVALRKLVEAARRANESKDRARRSQEAAYRFLSAMAGNLTGFEEATRALFAGAREHFDAQVQSWPADVRDHARKLAAVAFDGMAGP